MLLGECDERVRFFQRSGDGFFHEDIDAGAQQLRGDDGVMDSGDGDGCSIARRRRAQEFLHGRINRKLKLRAQGRGQGQVGFHNSDELDGGTGGLNLSPDAKMVAPEGTSPYNGDAG